VASLLGELGHRWSRARRAALLPLVGGAEGDEHALIAAVPAERWDEALQRVFDHSLRLADSFRRYNRQQLSMADVAAYLPALGLDCLSACAARPRADAMELVREPCAAQPTTRLCNYTRECALGMTLGLTDGRGSPRAPPLRRPRRRRVFGRAVPRPREPPPLRAHSRQRSPKS
jgi:hypothetical protein